jgi:glycogen operon protein
LRSAQIEWHGVKLNCPDWSEYSHSIAFTAHAGPFLIHGMLNAYWQPLDFELPPVPDGQSPWLRIIDTALAQFQDICTSNAATVSGSTYAVQARSLVFLVRRFTGLTANGRDR